MFEKRNFTIIGAVCVKTFSLVAVLLLLASCANTSLQRSCFNLNAELENDIGYCHAVRVGNTLYISGTVGRGPMSNAIKEVYSSIEQTLVAHDLGFDNVVSERVYVTRLDDFVRNKGLRRDFYGEVLPASSWVQVDKLFLTEFVIEVEVMAVFPKKFKLVSPDSW